MEWLSPEVADHLQLFTLPLEIIGLLLATIEVRFAALTQWLNVRLVGLHDAVVRSDLKWRREHPRLASITVWKRFHVPMPAWLHFTMLALVVVALLGALTLRGLESWPAFDGSAVPRQLFDRFAWWVYIPILVAAILMTASIRFVVSFARDRAVGTLGLVVAGLGVLGEAYQFTVGLVA
ncbi:MAG: hypothetical protein AAGA68_07350 [Pseudomonadota bacterium]